MPIHCFLACKEIKTKITEVIQHNIVELFMCSRTLFASRSLMCYKCYMPIVLFTCSWTWFIYISLMCYKHQTVDTLYVFTKMVPYINTTVQLTLHYNYDSC